MIGRSGSLLSVPAGPATWLSPAELSTLRAWLGDEVAAVLRTTQHRRSSFALVAGILLAIAGATDLSLALAVGGLLFVAGFGSRVWPHRAFFLLEGVGWTAMAALIAWYAWDGDWWSSVLLLAVPLWIVPTVVRNYLFFAGPKPPS